MEQNQGKLVGIKFYRGKDMSQKIREDNDIDINDVVKREIRELNPRYSKISKSEGFLTEFREVFEDKINN